MVRATSPPPPFSRARFHVRFASYIGARRIKWNQVRAEFGPSSALTPGPSVRFGVAVPPGGRCNAAARARARFEPPTA